MKSYVTDQQIRLVGKAWEIRRHLRMLLFKAGAQLTLADYLQEVSASVGIAGAASPLLKQAEPNKAASVIPFPSR